MESSGCFSRMWQRTQTWCQITEGSYHSSLIFNDMYNLLCILSLIGSLRVVLGLRVKRALEQTHCYGKRNSSMCSFSCKPNSFSWEKFCTRTCFDKQVQGNSEMAYYVKMLRQSVITAVCADLPAFKLLSIQTSSYKRFESVTSSI